MDAKRKRGRMMRSVVMALAMTLAMAWMGAATSAQLPQGLTYVWWQFEQPAFDDLQIDFELHEEAGEQPGIYLQFYQGRIGETGFYFGLQSDVYDPARGGGQGKGVLFSRWGTRDLANVRPVSRGWVQSAGYEGDFVGLRCGYEWTDHRYRFRLTRVDADGEGVWYGVFLLDYDTGREDYFGAIRFERGEDGEALIQSGGGSWTEVYSGAEDPAEVPAMHLTYEGAWIEDRASSATQAVADYSKVPNSDIAVREGSRAIDVRFGRGVERRHEKGALY